MAEVAVVGAAPFPPFDWEAWYESVGGRRARTPEFNALFMEMEMEQLPLRRGPAAAKRVAYGTPEEASPYVKRLATDLGADVVGITTVQPEDVYAGRLVAEPRAIVIATRMDFDEMKTAPSAAAAFDMGRAYRDCGKTCTELALRLRADGHEATVQHPVLEMDVLFLPLAERAGLGELGRHGSLIGPDFGPMFRLGAVTTDAPLAVDEPQDLGIAKFCDNCDACRVACPPQAIAKSRADPLGKDRYVIDTDTCFPYFAEEYYCGICLAVCPFNKAGFRTLFKEGRAPLPKKPRFPLRVAPTRRVDVSVPLAGQGKGPAADR